MKTNKKFIYAILMDGAWCYYQKDNNAPFIEDAEEPLEIDEILKYNIKYFTSKAKMIKEIDDCFSFAGDDEILIIELPIDD